jgi:hypothetical protein
MLISKEDISTVAGILSLRNEGFWILNKRKLAINTENFSILEWILPRVIDTLIQNPEWAYKRIKIPKKSWWMRIIHAPLWEAVIQINANGNSISLLSWIQKRINHVLGFVLLPNSVCAFHPWVDPYKFLRTTLDQLSRNHINYSSTSSIANAIWWIFKIDIKDFFNSISEDQVRIVWEKSLPNLTGNSYSKEIIDILTLLSCYDGKLNQWPPSSPTIANIVWYIGIDSKLSWLEQTRNIWSNRNPKSLWIRYLRYADDIMILSFDGAIPSDVPHKINEAVVNSWFRIAEQKTLLLNDSHSYPLLWISLMRDKSPVGFQFQIGTARDRVLASELLWHHDEWMDSIIWKLWFNKRISLLWKSWVKVENFPWRYSKRVAHALSMRSDLLWWLK